MVQAVTRIHLKQSKGGRNLLNTRQGSGGQDSGGEAVYNKALGGGPYLKWKSEEVWGHMEFSFFSVLHLGVSSPLVSKG